MSPQGAQLSSGLRSQWIQPHLRTNTQLRNLMIQEWTIHFKPIKAGSTEGKEFQVSNDLKKSSCSGQYTH